MQGLQRLQDYLVRLVLILYLQVLPLQSAAAAVVVLMALYQQPVVLAVEQAVLLLEFILVELLHLGREMQAGQTELQPHHSLRVVAVGLGLWVQMAVVQLAVQVAWGYHQPYQARLRFMPVVVEAQQAVLEPVALVVMAAEEREVAQELELQGQQILAAAQVVQTM